MEKVVLEARVTQLAEGFHACIVPLGLEVAGDTMAEAQDDLVKAFRAWLESCEEQECLARILSEAGFEGANEDTELELHFVAQT